MIGQKRRHSLLEASLNTATGFCISYLLGLFIFPLFGFPVTPAQNFWIVLIYTVVSIVRSYIWRRTFNWWHHRCH